MKQFKKIRLIALDVDGVLLNDTYSPAIKSFVESHGGVYTPELERQVWGSPHIAGGHNMALACKLPWSAQKTIEEFFSHHAEYLKNNPINVLPGVEQFLKLLNQYNVVITSYGGRTKEYIFDKHMSHLTKYFDKNKPYIDTNSIRPGVSEICKDIFDYNYDEVLFIDDINRMAEVAKHFGAGFIGTPVTDFQTQQMNDTGVKYIAASISDITENVLNDIDCKLKEKSLW